MLQFERTRMRGESMDHDGPFGRYGILYIDIS